MRKGKPKVNASLKIDPDLKAKFEDWLWINRSSFGVEVENLIKHHLDQNPLSPVQQKMVDDWHKLDDARLHRDQINSAVKKELELPKAKKKK